MTSLAHSDLFHRRALRPARTEPARPGLLTRVFNAVFESREKEAARQAQRYLARTGGRFTDSIERELNDRLLNGGWRPPR